MPRQKQQRTSKNALRKAMLAQRGRKRAEDGGGKARIPERRLAVGDEIGDDTGARGDRQPEKKSSLRDLDFDGVLKAAPRRRGELGEAQAEARGGHALRNRRPRPVGHCRPRTLGRMIRREWHPGKGEACPFTFSVLNRARS